MAPKFQTMPGPPERKPLDPAYKSVRNFLLNSVTTQNSPAERLAQVIAPDFKSENKAGIYADNPDVEAMALNMIGPIAYHGSPHVFDKFSMQKIGTGEGAQAYGHGLYFTSEPKVAEQYRRELSGSPKNYRHPDLFQRGERLSVEPIGNMTPVDVGVHQDLQAIMARMRRDLGLEGADAGKAAYSRLYDQALKDLDNSRAGPSATYYRGRLDYLKSIDPEALSLGPQQTGSFHQVDIPDNLLDWDRPLAQQSPEVQRVAREFLATTGARPEGVEAYMTNATGQDLYERIAYQRGDPMRGNRSAIASEALRAAGIPGHSYIGDSSGVRNFVMYDDAPIKPLSRASSLAEWLKSQKEGK